MHAEFGLKREANQNLFIGDWVCDKGVFHFHSQIELYFVTAGEMDVFVLDRRTRLSAGEMSVALSYVPHGYATPEYSRSSTLIIPTHMCPEFLSVIEHKRAHDPFIRDKEKVSRILGALENLRREDINEVERRGYIYVILGIVSGALELSPAVPMENDVASKILNYINENYKRQDVTPASVCEEFGYNAAYVSRFFRASFGVGLKKYITLLRLRAALEMIDGGRHSVTYAVMECGFGSPRSFYRAFREELGCTPKEYLSSGGVRNDATYRGKRR